MKKIKYLIIMGLLSIITTGCVKFNVNMDIKSDKSMNFSIIYAFDKTLMQGEGNSLKESDFEELKKNGFTVTKYQNGNYEGFTISKKINNIDEVSKENTEVIYNLSGLMSNNESSKEIFKVVKENNKNTYYAKIKFNANESNDTVDDELPDEVDDEYSDDEVLTTETDFSSMMSGLDLSFNVTLPNSAISNNATKAENDNKKLSWTLLTNGDQYIEFAFSIGESNNWLMYGLIGGGVLLLIGMVLLLTKKKNNDTFEGIEPNLEKKEKINL